MRKRELEREYRKITKEIKDVPGKERLYMPKIEKLLEDYFIQK